MTKAHKHQQNLLTQFEAEIEMLSDKVDALEDECGESEQARLKLEGQLSEVTGQRNELQKELDRKSARLVIQPEGHQELLDQLEMANEVKEALCNDIAMRTEELAAAKLQYAQVVAEKEEQSHRLRRAENKSKLLSLRMTKLEVALADAQNVAADDEEEKALVFKQLLVEQESRIRELEASLAESKRGKKLWPF
jgi:chromosome segregation ATPase